MNISLVMSLTELADRMGGASYEEAFEMRSILCRVYLGDTTYDVPDGEWRYMCDKAVKQAAQKNVD